MPRLAKLKEFRLCGKLIAIENDMGLTAAARLPRKLRMLAALTEFPEVSECAVRRRHAGIVFLDAATHFRNQCLLQGGGRAEQTFGVGVFRVQMRTNVGREHGRVL